MKFKTTYILFGVLGAMMVLMAVVLWNVLSQAPEDVSKYVLPSAHDAKAPLTADAVDRVEIERARPEAAKIVFVRDKDSKRWEIVEPRELRANHILIEGLVGKVLNATQVEQAEQQKPGMKDAGLDPPAAVVTLKAGAERTLKLNLGEASAGASKAVLYVTSSDRSKEPIAVRKGDLADLFKKVNDYRDPYLLASSTSDVASVSLTEGKTGSSQGPLELYKDGPAWRYKDQTYDGPAEEGDSAAPPAPDAPPNGVQALLDDLTKFKVDDKEDKEGGFVEDGTKDLEKYNLDPAKAEVLTVAIRRVEKAKVEGGKEETTTAPVEVRVGVSKKVDKAEQYYAAVKNKAGAFDVAKVAVGPVESVRQLFKKPGALRSHNLAPFGGFRSPDAVEVRSGGEVLEFRREDGNKPWQFYRGGELQSGDSAAIQDFVNQLVQKGQVKSYIDAKPDLDKLGLKEPKVVVSMWSGAVEKEKPEAPKEKDDKKDDKKPEDDKKAKLVLKKDVAGKPDVRLSFGVVEDKQAVIQREVKHGDGYDTSVVKADEFLYDKVRAGALAYLDKSLPHFNEMFHDDENVVQLTLERDGVTYQISRAEPKDDSPWKFDAPKELVDAKAKPDPFAVKGILAALNGLRATKLIADKPAAGDWDKTFAEDEKPAPKDEPLRAVVTKKDDKTVYAFDFGRVVDKVKDANSRYAKQSQRPIIFTVNKAELALLQRELRDTTVFAFDPGKIKTIKLGGWKSVVGATFVLELEQKEGGQWTAKAPPGFEIDSTKVHSLAAGLAGLRAERFVNDDAKIKAAFDKDEDKTALVIDLTIEEEKGKEPKQLQLKVVNLTGDKAGLTGADKGYYASTGELKGDLFQVPKDLFEGPMSKPPYFNP